MHIMTGHPPVTLFLASRFTREYEPSWAAEVATAQSSPRALLAVSFDDPDDIISRWQARLSSPPECVQVVSVDEFSRSTGPDGLSGGNSPFSVTTIGSPGDLTRLGIELTEFLETHADKEPGEVLVTVESLTPMLQYADLEQVYRFVHVLTNLIRRTGAASVIHLDPEAHSPQVVATFTSLFDRRVVVDEEGNRAVTDRPHRGRTGAGRQSSGVVNR